MVSQITNLLGSNLSQGLSPNNFHEIPTSSICVILLTNRQTDNQIFMKIIPPCLR